VLPALGYGAKQIAELDKSIGRTPCDTVILGTPCDLSRLFKIDRPVVRISFELKEMDKPNLEDVLNEFLKKLRHSFVRY
jgi:predicted GTPase